MNKEELIQFVINIAPVIGSFVGSLIVMVNSVRKNKETAERVRREVDRVSAVKMGTTYKALQQQNEELIQQNYELMQEIKNLKRILTKGREE